MAAFRIPAGLNGKSITSVAACVTTASTSGTPTINIRRERSGSAVSIFNTKLTIDANEKDSSTAATGYAFNSSNVGVQTGDQILIDVDVAGTGTKGLVVEITFG